MSQANSRRSSIGQRSARRLPLPPSWQLACLGGYRVRFATAADLDNELVAAQARNTLQKRLVRWALPNLALSDELGYLSFDARHSFRRSAR